MCFAQWTCSSQKSTVGSDWPEHDYIILKHIFDNRRFGPRAGAGTAVRWARSTSRPRNLDRTTSRHLNELKIVYRPHCDYIVFTTTCLPIQYILLLLYYTYIPLANRASALRRCGDLVARGYKFQSIKSPSRNLYSAHCTGIYNTVSYKILHKMEVPRYIFIS